MDRQTHRKKNQSQRLRDQVAPKLLFPLQQRRVTLWNPWGPGPALFLGLSPEWHSSSVWLEATGLLVYTEGLDFLLNGSGQGVCSGTSFLLARPAPRFWLPAGLGPGWRRLKGMAWQSLAGGCWCLEQDWNIAVDAVLCHRDTTF